MNTNKGAKMKKLIISLCVIVLFANVAQTKQKYDPNKDYGFVLNEKINGIQNPPPNKARIYGFMPNKTLYYTTRYNATIHTLEQANNDFSEGYFFGFTRPGEAFYMDIVPSGEPVFISAKMGARKHIYFTPQAGKIYCVKMELSGGLGTSAKFTLIEKQECTTYVSQHIRSDFMRQWLEDKQRFENPPKKEEKQTSSKSISQDGEWDW